MKPFGKKSYYYLRDHFCDSFLMNYLGNDLPDKLQRELY